MLADMAGQELTGTPFSQAQMDFINQTVHVQQMCGGGYVEGWYSKLFFASDGTKEDPTIADVHTQYTDEGGNVVGRVLHVGAADPRLMITTINTCSGPKAYAGLAFSYHELVTENFQRLTDQDWTTMLAAGSPPADVPWLSPVLGP